MVLSLVKVMLILNISLAMAQEAPINYENSILLSDYDQLKALLRQEPQGRWATSAFSCTDLMSETPTALLSRVFGPQLKPHDYAPVCTLLTLRKYVLAYPHRNSQEEMVSDYLNSWHRRDAMCRGSSGLGFEELEYFINGPSSFTAPTAAQLQQIRNQFRQTARNFSYTCCGSNRACRNEMSNINFKFCSDIRDDEELSTFCSSASLFFYSPHSSFHFIRHLNFLRSDTHMQDTAIFMNESKYSLVSSHVFTHELAHACESYHARNMELHGDSASEAILNEFTCALTAQNINYYHRLFRTQGMSSATISCLDRVIQKSDRCLFNPSEQSATCKRSKYTETFASWLEARRGILYDFGNFLEKSCTSLNDKKHSAAFQNLECFLKTPQFKEQYINASGCRR